MLVVNASNIIKDFNWIAGARQGGGGDAVAVNTSSRYALHRACRGRRRATCCRR